MREWWRVWGLSKVEVLNPNLQDGEREMDVCGGVYVEVSFVWLISFLQRCCSDTGLWGP